MIEVLAFPFMQRALMAGVIVGVVCSLIGVFVVLRGLAFIGDGVAHASFAGIALGVFLGLPPVGVAFFVCAAFAVLTGVVSRLGEIREETSIGMLFAAFLAVGVILIRWIPSGELDVLSLLFGNVLTLSPDHINTASLCGAVVVLLVALFYKEFSSIVFDEEFSWMIGIPARLLSYLLLVLMAAAIVISIRLVGVIMVSALIVTPAATALQLSGDFDRVTIFSVIIGVFSIIIGLLASYHLNAPPGASVVAVATALFVASVIWRRGIRQIFS